MAVVAITPSVVLGSLTLTATATLEAAAQLRTAGVRVQVSTRIGKLGKQFKDASSKGIPFALVCGPDEAAAGTVVLKNLTTGEQVSGTAAELIREFSG